MDVIIFPAATLRPLRTTMNELDGVTAIMRQWRPGDAARCRLCPDCTARGDACLVQTTRSVLPHLAPGFGLVDDDSDAVPMPTIRRELSEDCA